MARSKMNKLGLDNTVVKTKNRNIYEDTTEYGEFISSFDNWITLEEQKRNAEYLANLEKEDKERIDRENSRNMD
ncbi:MAG: hypothetical protein J6C46_10800 [Clostridia bacterium]|nr:hypothetical protein [Clostridia bacterium]